MIVRGSSRPESQPQESVTQRLERLRAEHRRHIRNIGNAPSQSSGRGLVTVGPSLPDVDAAPAIDNWNNNGIQVARRPRPGNPPPPNLNPPRAPERILATGPPPPRSWVNPSARTPQVSSTRRRDTPTKAPHRGPSKVPRRAAPKMTVIERLKLREEELMASTYAEEYWFRAAGDARWSTWREEALRIVFSYSAGSAEGGKQLLEESPFTTFGGQSEGSRMPTLFETVLRFIFASPSPDMPDAQEPDIDSVEIIQYLPPHIQKRVLRYAAAQKPLTEDQLRTVYLNPQEDDLGASDPNQFGEVILSGRKVEADILEKILEANHIPDVVPPTLPTTVQLQSIVLFQTPFLQKRLLTTFPKTLTTLGLIALPPPKGMLWEGGATGSASSSNIATDAPSHQCSCPWCASNGATVPSTNQPRPRPSASTPTATSSISAAPHTSPALIPQLVDLPALLPSLVILDVSYNPWMSSDSILQKDNLLRKRKVEHPGVGIFGAWDLRLWGRMKVLSLRGCFEPSSDADEREDIEGPLRLDGDVLLQVDVPPMRSSFPCACGIPQTSGSGWRNRDVLLGKWEKTMFAVGRSFEVIWREHECRCGAAASSASS